ncbi:hypothetical protein EIN_280480 [Entamoeba invadens IP1]|uniref:Major facilitator superfamily (MFS) profile domain-containing protein n=1 Tax=Entamoeba invadens IP1 TaxID=370355 RepID=A0A0A1U847_ENTIV|nr:hypothetical protein EIN_280480 [Entamoeba invadens IP1]ELP91001.1 hypothetical protein EIN_280480 [Entamoeba invadens IP1]|eukprot:XP_004257772.1 hypothetical protein EIN_280480 [Entamoeba invadens IP1]
MDSIRKIITFVTAPIKNFFSNFFPKDFPKRKLFPLLLMLIIEAVSQTIINSYIGYLIVDMGMVTSTNQAGRYSGWLISSFSIAQFLSAFLIGAMSDNFGRRPILLIGTFGIALCNILFGFSTNYYYAICVRLMCGFLNGNVGVIKTYMGELTTDSNRVQTFSFVGLCWSFGAVFGNFLGGVLYNPVRLYPTLFQSAKVFKMFPALLPQLFVSVLGFFSYVMAYFYLLENTKNSSNETENIKTAQNKCKKFGESFKKTFTGMSHFFIKENLWSLCASLEYACLAFLNTTFITIYPLLMIASVGHGGLGQTTEGVGYFAAISSLGGFFTLLFLYKPLVNYLGLRYTFILSSVITALFYGIFPSLEGVNGSSKMVQWSVFGVYAFVWNVCSQNCFSSISVLIVNGTTNQYMGAANGVAQTFGSLTRVVGPICVSPFLSWCLNNGLKYPLNQYMPFYLMMILGITTSVLVFAFPLKVDFVKKEKIGADVKEEKKNNHKYKILKEKEDKEGDLEIEMNQVNELEGEFCASITDKMDFK